MSIAAIGNQNGIHICSEESKKLLSKAKMGNKNPNWSGKYNFPEGLTRN